MNCGPSKVFGSGIEEQSGTSFHAAVRPTAIESNSTLSSLNDEMGLFDQEPPFPKQILLARPEIFQIPTDSLASSRRGPSHGNIVVPHFNVPGRAGTPRWAPSSCWLSFVGFCSCDSTYVLAKNDEATCATTKVTDDFAQKPGTVPAERS